MSKEIPILYSTEMIRAKLSGIKTQTRRIVKFANGWDESFVPTLIKEKHRDGIDRWEMRCGTKYSTYVFKCPYGQPGDILYARETHYYEKYFNGLTENTFVRYKADMGDEPVAWNWRPNIFLHKEHCRIWDRIVNIRVERLQDISEEDAIAEGIEPYNGEHGPIPQNSTSPLFKNYGSSAFFAFRPIASYRSLWESINGTGSWDLNPWVWVIATETISTTGRPVTLR